MKKKKTTIADWLEEKRKQEVESTDSKINVIKNLPGAKDKYFASGVVITITDLAGNILTDSLINGENFEEIRILIINAYKKTLKSRSQFLQSKVNNSRQITYIPLFGKTLYPESDLLKMLEENYIPRLK